MPSGKASHKGHSVKPNTNANHIIDVAADLEADPREELKEPEGYEFDQEEKPVNPQVLQRPE